MSIPTDRKPEPAERPPAPAPLRLVQRFANTVDIEGEGDDLLTSEGFRAFLADADLPGADEPAGDADLERARTLRDAVRALLEANHGDEPDPSAIEVLNDFARTAELELRFDRDGAPGLRACCALPMNVAFGRILEAIYAATADGTFSRLKICKMDTCRWAFYDHSRNHSGSWCSMSICGNRAKARAYRARRMKDNQ